MLLGWSVSLLGIGMYGSSLFPNRASSGSQGGNGYGGDGMSKPMWALPTEVKEVVVPAVERKEKLEERQQACKKDVGPCKPVEQKEKVVCGKGSTCAVGVELSGKAPV